MANGRKQIAFDLDTASLKNYYPNESWNNAYEDIKRHMNKNGFSWRQGSVYMSDNPLSVIATSNIILALVQKYQWLNVCMRDCVVTNIGREHSQNYLFNNEADVPMRENKKAL